MVEGFGAQRFAQRLRHDLCIAKIAHVAKPSAGANQACQVVALLTRSLGQGRAVWARYVHRSQKRAQPAGRINRAAMLNRSTTGCQLLSRLADLANSAVSANQGVSNSSIKSYRNLMTA
jgi:hypothetical protein